MKRFLSLAALCLLAAGCSRHIVRDAQTYQVELNQYHTWATGQAELLKGFMAEQCACDEAGVFTTEECGLAADYVLTIEARATWHKAMAEFNAGLIEERPDETPPVIPESSTLCTAGVE